MYDELGETAGAMHCIEQIKVLANAELAATPGHVQLRRAEAEAATCRKQLAALQVKKEDLAKKMGEVELCLANAQAARQTAEQRVEEVKRRIVQPSVGVSQSSAPLGSKAQAELAKALPEILPADFGKPHCVLHPVEKLVVFFGPVRPVGRRHKIFSCQLDTVAFSVLLYPQLDIG